MPSDTQALFIHIPKCAGTSVDQALYGKPLGHPTAALYMAWNLERFHSMPSFAILRNPCDRFCSIFYHFISSPRRTQEVESHWRLHFAASSPTELAHRLGEDGRLRHRFMTLVHARPQVDWVKVEGKVAVDHLFRFEALGKLEVFLKDYLNDQDFKLIHTNGSIRQKPWGEELDHHAKRVIERLYREDFELWESIC